MQTELHAMFGVVKLLRDFSILLNQIRIFNKLTFLTSAFGFHAAWVLAYIENIL